MKRYIAVLLTLTLLLVGCKGKDNPDETKDTGEILPVEVDLDENAVSEVLAEWEKMIEAAELKGMIELWALDYIEAYCATPTVPNMQRALAACEAAVASLRMIQMEDCSLSSETLSALAEDGVDMSFVPIEYNSLKSSITTDVEVWQGILGSLLTDSFWKYGIEYLEGWSQVRRDTVELYNLFTVKMTNAVLLSLGEDESSDTYSRWTESAVTLFDGSYTWNSDHQALAEEMSDILDKMEEKIVESSRVTSVLSANYAMFSEAGETDDWSAVYDVAVDFEDRFVPVALPDWGDGSSDVTLYSYRYDEVADVAEFTAVGDELTAVPDGFIYQCENISRDAFFEYVDYIGAMGLNYYPGGSTIDEDSVSLMYLDVCLMSLKWEGNTASIYFYDSLPLLTPSWYIFYMAQK